MCIGTPWFYGKGGGGGGGGAMRYAYLRYNYMPNFIEMNRIPVFWDSIWIYLSDKFKWSRWQSRQMESCWCWASLISYPGDSVTNVRGGSRNLRKGGGTTYCFSSDRRQPRNSRKSQKSCKRVFFFFFFFLWFKGLGEHL